MSQAVKVWCPARETEPEGLFNKATCPDAPANWFREDPEYAAELYALELHGELAKAVSRVPGMPKRSHVQFDITVVDDQGATHKFAVEVGYELTAHTKKVS